MYFTKKKRVCDCGKQQNVNHMAPGGASDGLFCSPPVVAADQLVVVHLRERGTEMGGGDRGIKSDSAALSPGSVCWLSSSKQIETNRICRSCSQ